MEKSPQKIQEIKKEDDSKIKNNETTGNQFIWLNSKKFNN